MAPIVNRPVTTNYLVSEASGMYRSRDEATVTNTSSTATLLPGTLLGRLTATGVFVRHTLGASDGSQTVAGILFEEVAPSSTKERTVTRRDCEVAGSHLIYATGSTEAQINTANAALLALGIVVR